MTRKERQFPSSLGASYFQIECHGMLKKMVLSFPSPLGASYFQINETRNFTKVEEYLFPSPLGASYFQILTGVWR